MGSPVEKLVAKAPDRRLSRAVLVSAVLHVALAVVTWWLVKPEAPAPELVDIELAPPPPKAEALPEEVAKPPADTPPAAAGANEPGGHEDEHEEGAPVDAGVDAPLDAPLDAPVDAAIDAPRKKRTPDAAELAVADAGIDAPQVAQIDDAGSAAIDAPQVAQADAAIDAPQVADLALGSGSATGSNAGSNRGSNAGSNQLAMAPPPTGSGSAAASTGSGFAVGSAGSGSAAGSGVAAAIIAGSGAGVPGMDNQPAVAGAATSAGTAANLLAYFPPDHLITALVRFDRLRGTEWAQPAEDLFHPMPDYRALFGTRDADIADKLDMLVISTPRPRDAIATTLVAHTHLSRAEMRDLLAATGATWSATRAGMLGKRKMILQGDKRLVLSPWKNWFVLAAPEDLGALPPGGGSLDTVEARVKLPAWLQTIRTIEKESGDDKQGPALVVTLTGEGKRYTFPDVGLGVTSLPAPTRLSLAMELVQQGWLVRGNIVFASEADAAEVEKTLLDVQKRVVTSFLISRLLKQQHVYNLIAGMSISRSGARVSYATSVSISDARALLAALAGSLADYFGH